MKPHLSMTASPAGGAADLTERKTILVSDLTRDPACRPLWRSGRVDADPPANAPAGLAEHGFASPMGFWLSSPALPTSHAVGGIMITFHAQGDEAPPASSIARSPDGTYTRIPQSLRVKSPNAGEGDVLVTIGPGGARITCTPAAWKSAAEPVLLGLCQYWRFAAIDAEIARLTEHAHADLDHSNMPGIGTLRAHKRVVQSARDVRSLLLDLPHFQGPLTDPYPFCTTERAAQIYESLSEKLRLEEWCELIDERAEAIEDAYEALSEKLFEYKNFAWEAGLETLIIVILLAELGLGLYEAFSP